jgi:hypothetical protein
MTWPLVGSYSPNMTILDFVSLIMCRLGPIFSQNKYPFYFAHHVFFSSHVKKITIGPTTIKVGNQFRVFGCWELLENASLAWKKTFFILFVAVDGSYAFEVYF